IVPNNKNDDMRLDRVELGVLSICDRSWSSSRGDQSERERHVNPEELRELSRDPKRPDRSGFNTGRPPKLARPPANASSCGLRCLGTANVAAAEPGIRMARRYQQQIEASI